MLSLISNQPSSLALCASNCSSVRSPESRSDAKGPRMNNLSDLEALRAGHDGYDRANKSRAGPMGSKRGQAHPLMSHLAGQGWVCVAINYRLSPKSDWPAAVVDVKRAIAWIKSNIAGYGGDPRFIAITGGSAGGHLSALAALTPNVS